MAEHHSGERYMPGEAGEEEIHLPSPTVAPPIIGLGVTILTFGVLGLRQVTPPVTNPLGPIAPVLLIVGAVLMIAGIALWLYNDAREFIQAGDHGGHGAHH